MRKDRVLAGALAAVTAFSMTACGGGQAGGTTQAAAAGTQAAAENTANPNAETTLSIGYTTAANADDPYHFTATKFKEIVEEYVSSYVPANGALDLPFIFSDLAQAREIVDGDFGQSLIDNMDGTGVTCLAFSEGGFRQLCTKDKEIKAPSDLNGLKIRCMETKIYLSAYKALGVNATPMAWGELLTALQQGTVDGCDAPLSVLYTNGFPDICKYIDNVNLFYSPLPVCISTSVYESLSEEDQAILKEAAQEAAKETRENNDATAEKMESDLTSQGMTIVSSEDVDTEAFQSAVQPCYDEMESYIGSEWVDQIKSLTGTEG